MLCGKRRWGVRGEEEMETPTLSWSAAGFSAVHLFQGHTLGKQNGVESPTETRVSDRKVQKNQESRYQLHQTLSNNISRDVFGGEKLKISSKEITCRVSVLPTTWQVFLFHLSPFILPLGLQRVILFSCFFTEQNRVQPSVRVSYRVGEVSTKQSRAAVPTF